MFAVSKCLVALFATNAVLGTFACTLSAFTGARGEGGPKTTNSRPTRACQPVQAKFVAPRNDNFAWRSIKLADRRLAEAILGNHCDALERVQEALDNGADPNRVFPKADAQRRDINLFLSKEISGLSLDISSYLTTEDMLSNYFSKEAISRVMVLGGHRATILMAAAQYASEVVVALLLDRVKKSGARNTTQYDVDENGNSVLTYALHRKPDTIEAVVKVLSGHGTGIGPTVLRAFEQQLVSYSKLVAQ